jgi:pyruvate/2-oxoglutarate dehydrogenase complex dihydrolipoamide dehydrogenase (E3) component
MIGIIDWRLCELERLGVPIHYNVFAEAADILERNPDLVVIATGGIAQNPLLDAGDDLVVSSWDIIAGAIKPEGPVLLYDDNGAHTGMTAAEMIAATGAELEIVSPERMFAPEIGGMNHVPYAKAFAEKNVRVTINTKLKSVRREGNQLVAVLGSDYSDKASVERRVAQVVVEHGTLPMAELYLELKPLSRNLGAVDYKALIKQQNPIQMRNPDGAFDLFRIGDAVASRNIHAGIYDALRYGVLF